MGRWGPGLDLFGCLVGLRWPMGKVCLYLQHLLMKKSRFRWCSPNLAANSISWSRPLNSSGIQGLDHPDPAFSIVHISQRHFPQRLPLCFIVPMRTSWMEIVSYSQNFASACYEEPFYQNLDAWHMMSHHHLDEVRETDESRMALGYSTSALVCTRQTDTAIYQNRS